MAIDDIDMNTFAAIVLCRFEYNIERLINQISDFFDVIVVVIDTERDNSFDIIKECNKRVNKIRIIPSQEGDFQKLRNHGDSAAADCLWHLHIDPDETFDRRYLIRKEMLARKYKTTSFRFPRVNLPDCKDYPDYQVRVFKYDNGKTIEWRNNRHEVLWYIPTNQRLDKYDCVTLDDYKIVHDARRTDLKRDWW